MNRVEFIFDNVRRYALYEIFYLDGMEEYYLELRDLDLIREFGLEIKFKRDAEGHLLPLLPADSDGLRKKELLETILLSIDQEASSIS